MAFEPLHTSLTVEIGQQVDTFRSPFTIHMFYRLFPSCIQEKGTEWMQANETLETARKRKFGSVERAAAACGVSEKSFRRWELGKVKPTWESIRQLETGFGMSAEELGFGELISNQAEDALKEENAPASRQPTNESLEASTSSLPSQEEMIFASQLLGGNIMAFDPSKRANIGKLLKAGGILSTAHLLQAEPWAQLLAPKSNEQPRLEASELQYFADLVQTCWHLSSAQLQSVEQLLPIFLPAVEHEAHQPSDQQRLAANIACQAEQLASIVALHRDDLLAMEIHRQRAVYFGELSGDMSLYVTASMRLATTYYYLMRPRKAYDTYQQAIPHLSQVTPLVRARTYIGIAEAAARCGKVQEALAYRSKAHEAFPRHPDQDESAIYADGGHFTLALWESLTYMNLDLPEEAAAALQQVKQKPSVLLPARVGAELINHQATASIAMKRLEESATLVEEGVRQALRLGSQRRYSEAYNNYQQMRLLWRREQRVVALGELFRQA